MPPLRRRPHPERAEAALLAALYPVPGERGPDAGYPSASRRRYTETTVLCHPEYRSYPGLLSPLASLYAVAWHKPRISDARLDFAGTGRKPVVIGTLLARDAPGGAPPGYVGGLAGGALAFRVSLDPRSLACETAEDLACLWAAIASEVAPATAILEAVARARDVLLASHHDGDVSVDDYALAAEGLEPLLPEPSPAHPNGA